MIKEIKNKKEKKDKDNAFAGGFSNDYNYDDFDDAMYDMTTPITFHT